MSRATASGGLALWMLCTGCGPILGIEDTALSPREDPKCTLLPHWVFFADKPIADTTVSLSIPTRAEFAKVASALGTEVDDTRGHVLAGLTDCDGMLLDTAELTIEPADAAGPQFIVDDGSGVFLGEETSEPGHAGFLNVQAKRELKLFARPSDLTTVSSIGDPEAEPGTMSYVLLEPNSEAPDPTTPPQHFACLLDDSPTSVPAMVTISVRILTSATLDPALGDPAEGVRIRVCADNGDPCAIDLDLPLEEGVEVETDERGEATLEVRTGEDGQMPEGFDGQLRIAGRVSGCG